MLTGGDYHFEAGTELALMMLHTSGKIIQKRVVAFTLRSFHLEVPLTMFFEFSGTICRYLIVPYRHP